VKTISPAFKNQLNTLEGLTHSHLIDSARQVYHVLAVSEEAITKINKWQLSES